MNPLFCRRRCRRRRVYSAAQLEHIKATALSACVRDSIPILRNNNNWDSRNQTHFGLPCPVAFRYSLFNIGLRSHNVI